LRCHLQHAGEVCSHGAQPAASTSSSGDSSDSYNGDDARHYLCGWNEVLGRYREVVQESERLEATLTTSQVTLATVEGESNVSRV
jgi:hypothetical protein